MSSLSETTCSNPGEGPPGKKAFRDPTGGGHEFINGGNHTLNPMSQGNNPRSKGKQKPRLNNLQGSLWALSPVSAPEQSGGCPY